MKRLLQVLALAVLAAFAGLWLATQERMPGEVAPPADPVRASPSETPEGPSELQRSAVPAHPSEIAAHPAVDCEKRFAARFVREEDGGPVPAGQLGALYGEGF